MRSIDIHAHVVPRSMWKAIAEKTDWYGFRYEPDEGLGVMVGGGMRTGFTSPKLRYTAEERLKDMDAQKVDVQVLSIHMPFVGYHLDAAQGRALARDFNDELAGTVREQPARFAGLIDAGNGLEPDFRVQVGDIKGGGAPCTEEAYRTVLDLMQRSEPPLIYTPGDNEWTDCRRP